MTTDDLKRRAEVRFQQALEASGARDPREFYRTRLRALRSRDTAGFDAAVDHYEHRLLPAVAAEGSDPLGEWLEYGRVLAALTAAGDTVQIDPSGHASPYAPPVPREHLVLHLPSSARESAIPVGLPVELSPAQRATFALLVDRKTQ